MTPAEFKTDYPQFSSVADADIQRQIDLFATLYQGDYGDAADYLLGLFVAHQISVATAGGNGPLQTATSRSVGDVSVGYAQSSGASTAGDFASTKYGLEFARLIRLFGMGPVRAQAFHG